MNTVSVLSIGDNKFVDYCVKADWNDAVDIAERFVSQGAIARVISDTYTPIVIFPESVKNREYRLMVRSL